MDSEVEQVALKGIYQMYGQKATSKKIQPRRRQEGRLQSGIKNPTGSGQVYTMENSIRATGVQEWNNMDCVQNHFVIQYSLYTDT